MTASAWMLSILLASAIDVPAGPPIDLPIQNETVSRSSAEAKAIDSLDDPLGEVPFDGNFSGAPSLSNQSYRYYFGSEDQIRLLIYTKAAVNHDLLERARRTKSLRVRYRAVFILTQRRCEFVASILERMCESDDVEERYLAWNTYRIALSDKMLKPPKGFERSLKLYAREQNSEIRWEIVEFFGEARAKDAAPALIERVEKKEHSENEIWALGEIGDPKAVPAIIKAFPRKSGQDIHLMALGKIATPEAVDFIIENLDKYKAVEALCLTKSSKALPALKMHLKNLQQAKDEDSEIAATRIAIIRLSKDDAREPLLRLAEDGQETDEVRIQALRALKVCDTAPMERRILKIYKSANDVDIMRCCVQLLEDGTVDGITEAMLDHVLSCTRAASKDTIAMQDDLREALNKRLDKSFRKFEDLQAYVKDLRKASR